MLPSSESRVEISNWAPIEITERQLEKMGENIPRCRNIDTVGGISKEKFGLN